MRDNRNGRRRAFNKWPSWQVALNQLIHPAWIFPISLLVACDREGAAPPPPPTPTSVSGQVFAQTDDGRMIYASGRTVSLMMPDSAALSEAKKACDLDNQFNESLMARIGGTRKVGASEPSLQEQIRMKSWLLMSKLFTALRYNGEEVESVTADASGRFRFLDNKPGPYVLVVKHNVGDDQYVWIERVVILANRENEFVLGTDAADWPGKCSLHFQLQQDISARQGLD